MNMFPLDTLNYYHSLHSLPTFVKEAAVVTTDAVEGLPQTAFADPLRKLPLHTKAATWCSALSYYSGAIEDQTGVAEHNIKRAADFWGIGEECRKIRENLEKDAAPRLLMDEDFALLEEYEGHKVRKLPVYNMSQVKASAEDLVKSANAYPLEWRRKAAQRIIKRASELSLKLVNEHQLNQMAGMGMAKASEIVPHLRLRARIVKDAAVRERLVALADAVEKCPNLDNKTLSKMAEALDIADRATGLYSHYHRGIETPEAIFHKHSQVELQEKRAGIIALTNGQGVSKEALAKTPADSFTALGDDFVSAIKGESGFVDVEKAAEIVPTLPADDANLFVNSL